MYIVQRHLVTYSLTHTHTKSLKLSNFFCFQASNTNRVLTVCRRTNEYVYCHVNKYSFNFKLRTYHTFTLYTLKYRIAHVL